MRQQYMVFDEFNDEYTFYETYEEALKGYKEIKEYILEDSSGEERVFLFETKKMARLVEDKDKNEDPAIYGYDFWVKWKDEVPQ